MAKILVSIIAYREKDLKATVASCYENAKNKENLLFSIVEEDHPENYSDLSFIPENQILYRKYDLSDYRGILWARNHSTEVEFEYDYILYICGHTMFNKNWDETCLKEYKKALNKRGSYQAVLTFCGPDYEVYADGSINYDNTSLGRNDNYYIPSISKEFKPGFWFPTAAVPPKDGEVHEHYWIHYTWCFANKKLVEEVPLDPEMNFNGEEPYTTVQAWCRGWRFYATSETLYWHHTSRKYVDEDKPRYVTHRPWVDKNKEKYWKNSDESMLKLNRLLSGNLTGKYGDITKNQVLEFCKKSGMDERYTEYNPEYHKTEGYQHCVSLRHADPVE
jgi:hypothetical protein